MQVDGALERDLTLRETFGAHGSERLIGESRELSLDSRGCNLVKISSEKALEILAHVRVQHADRAQRAGVAWHVQTLTAESACNACTVHGTSPTRRHQREATWGMPTLNRDVLHRMQQVLLEHAQDAGGCLLDGVAKRLRHALFDGSARFLQIEHEPASGIGSRPETPKHELRIRDGRFRTAEAVTGGAGIG